MKLRSDAAHILAGHVPNIDSPEDLLHNVGKLPFWSFLGSLLSHQASWS